MQKIINIIAIDQENHAIACTLDGEKWETFPAADAALAVNDFPPGGGIVVGDGNVWTIRNESSISGTWASDTERATFLTALRENSYRAITVANKLANTMQHKYGLEPCDAVLGLWRDVYDKVEKFGQYDSGHEVRALKYPDISFGERNKVSRDFLRIQNNGGYESTFMEDAVAVAWEVLEDSDRKIFNLCKTKPSLSGSPRTIAAIACAIYNPWTGKLREYRGKPWGVHFITRNVLCLNGMMRGKGEHAPGSPMRAVLRATGRRDGKRYPVNQDERSRMDFCVRVLIRGYQNHGAIRPATTSDSITPGLTA